MLDKRGGGGEDTMHSRLYLQSHNRLENLGMFKFKTVAFSVFLAIGSLGLSSAQAEEVRYEAPFPDLPGYITLRCDFHMHTVFSDGQVWPTVRVAETWRQGLDAIAIADHIEYHPHKADVSLKLNRPYELAAGQAALHRMLFPRIAEITRDTPPGHFNALFLKDVTPLDTPEFLDAIKQANEQGAFVFWNHQGWQGEEKGRWLDVHTTMYEKKLFQGMEICNGDEYYPTAHRWCLEKNLTMLGNTDIHEPDLRKRSSSDDHRTMNLVFAKEKTLPAIKESLLERRTAVWWKDKIIGRKEILEPLFQGCIQVMPSPVWNTKAAWVQIRNTCAADIHLQRQGSGKVLKIPAQSTVLVSIAADKKSAPVEVKFTVANFLVAPGSWVNPQESSPAVKYSIDNLQVTSEMGLPVVLVIPKD